MKVYRVAKVRAGGESDGFAFFTSRAEAEREAGLNDPDDESLLGLNPEDVIEVRDVALTKAGVLKILRWWAGHADNG